MSKITLFLALCFMGAFSVYAQPFPVAYDSLEVNDLRARINTGGDLFWDMIGTSTFEVPKDSGKSTIFAGHVWMGALDESGQLRVSGQTYRQSGNDFWPGPVATTYDSSYFDRYGKVWKVSEPEIITHQNNFGQPGYVAPEGIGTWPGNGDTTNGEPWRIAPFFDDNSNGRYEPELGDYPLFRGDQAIFQIFSDAQFRNTETNGDSLGVDVYLMAYAYEAPNDPGLTQSMFLSYRIVNRSDQDFSEMYFGPWLDVDLGYFGDDYVGCDSALNLFYAYNADSLDDLPFGYGETPPVQGLVFLNQKLNHFRTYFPNFTPQGYPIEPVDYYHYLGNRWKDSSLLTLGGTGAGGTIPINHAYPGDPADSTQWSETSAGNTSGDRGGIGSHGPFSLGAGESFCLDMALVFARVDTGDHLASIPELKKRVAGIQAFYDVSETACDLYPADPVSGVAPALVEAPIQFSPNPATDVLLVRNKQQQGTLRIYDLQGRLQFAAVLNPGETLPIPLKSWAKGMYLIQLAQNGQQWSRKFLKQ